MSQKHEVAKAENLAHQLDDLLTERIASFSDNMEDPGAVQARHVFIYYREILHQIMDYTGLSHERGR